MAGIATSAAPPTTAPAIPPASAPSEPHPLDEQTFLVTPAAPPTSPFTYRFDFPRDQQYDGNGVTSFLQAVVNVPSQDVLEKLDAVNDTDSDATFLERARKDTPWLDGQMPSMVATAIRYHRVTFDFPIRDQGIGVLLPYLNYTRALANYVQGQARFATATGDYKSAVEDIRALFIFSDQVDQGDTFSVNNLVSVGMAAMSVGEVRRLVNRPDAPNLYWALRRLPAPFGNIREALHNEEAFFELSYPELREVRTGRELPAAEWRQILSRIRDDLDRWNLTRPAGSGSIKDLLAGHIDPARLAQARMDYARRYNRPATDVEQLDPTQTVAAYYYWSFRDAIDADMKWAELPYPVALARLDGDRRLATVQKDQPENPFVLLAGPFDLWRIVASNARLDRGIAATATVEAIRAYAAAHDGKLPAALADLVDTPAPDNPATGEPFGYAVTGDTAILSDAGPPGMKPLRYTERLRAASPTTNP